MEVVVGVFLPALMLRDYGRHAPRPSMEFAREITPYENPSIGGARSSRVSLRILTDFGGVLDDRFYENHSIASWAFHPRNAAVLGIPYNSNFGSARLVPLVKN